MKEWTRLELFLKLSSLATRFETFGNANIGSALPCSLNESHRLHIYILMWIDTYIVPNISSYIARDTWIFRFGVFRYLFTNRNWDVVIFQGIIIPLQIPILATLPGTHHHSAKLFVTLSMQSCVDRNLTNSSTLPDDWSSCKHIHRQGTLQFVKLDFNWSLYANTDAITLLSFLHLQTEMSLDRNYHLLPHSFQSYPKFHKMSFPLHNDYFYFEILFTEVVLIF